MNYHCTTYSPSSNNSQSHVFHSKILSFWLFVKKLKILKAHFPRVNQTKGHISQGYLYQGYISQGRISQGYASQVYLPGVYLPGVYIPGRYTPGRYSSGKDSPGGYTTGRYTPGRYIPGPRLPESADYAKVLHTCCFTQVLHTGANYFTHATILHTLSEDLRKDRLVSSRACKTRVELRVKRV